jgi:hypothetical protein
MKATNNATILISLLRGKNITIIAAKKIRGRHRDSHWSTLQHTSMGKKLQSILALSKKKSASSG